MTAEEKMAEATIALLERDLQRERDRNRILMRAQADLPLPAKELLLAYMECAAILRWLVEHEGECLTDNPAALLRAKAALASAAR